MDNWIDSSKSDWWDNRYKTESGSQWGDEPSYTALEAAENVLPGKKILIVGFGYGRELAYLSSKGFKVSGIESSEEAVKLTKEKMERENLAYDNLVVSAFESQTFFSAESFDAIVAHRVLHLIIDNEKVKAWIAMAHNLLTAKGKIFIGCRNRSDEAEGEVQKTATNIYLNKKRPGHLMRLWDREDFLKYFKAGFKGFQFKVLKEIESHQTGSICNITLMQAKKT